MQVRKLRLRQRISRETNNKNMKMIINRKTNNRNMKLIINRETNNKNMKMMIGLLLHKIIIIQIFRKLKRIRLFMNAIKDVKESF